MLISLGSIILTAAYLILIELLFKGWIKLPVFEIDNFDSSSDLLIDDDTHSSRNANLTASVVVSCKNEANNLPALIDSLKTQSIQSFELVLVDDNSTDDSLKIMKELTGNFTNVKIVQNEGKGKKYAMIQGVNAASCDVILTTDADCILPVFWVETVAKYHKLHQPELLLAPVVFKTDGSLFQELQKLEFTSLVATAAGAVGAQIPILANAANMSFTKSAFLDSINDLRLDLATGDDLFLLHSIKMRKGKIDYLKSQNALVETLPSENLKSFVKQRQRWASKSTALRDYQQIFIALVIVGISFLEILAFLSGLIHPYFWVYLVMMFVAKLSADYVFLAKVNPFFKNKNLFVNSFIISVLYPVYIVYTTVSSLFTSHSR